MEGSELYLPGERIPAALKKSEERFVFADSAAALVLKEPLD